MAIVSLGASLISNIQKQKIVEEREERPGTNTEGTRGSIKAKYARRIAVFCRTRGPGEAGARAGRGERRVVAVSDN